MKVAIYTISKDEAKHVKRWYESTKEADYHVIADTGSTDNTVEIARSLGITVVPIHVFPFRFDDARNVSLAVVPKDVDYCIALDMDEVLTPGWRKPLEQALADGIDRPHYRRIEAFNEDGSVASEFNGFKVHRRNGIRWNYPIHEVPQWYEEREEVKGFIKNFETHHLQDKTKSRGQYLPMLEMAVRENPDARNLYYLGREQSYHKQYDKSAENLKKYLELSIFPEERAAACRILSKCEPDNAEEWFLKGTEEFASRESILALANYYYTQAQWDECLLVSRKALEFNEKPTQFLAESWAWGHMAYDLVAISSWQLGDFKTAYEYGKKAVQISPNDERLVKNLEHYRSKIDAKSRTINQRGHK